MYIVAEDTETPVKLKVMNDLPAYQDGYVTPSTAEIKDREEQLATIEKLLNESLTKEELKSLIATTEKQVYDSQRSVKQAQIGLDKKKKELGDGTVYSEIDGGSRPCGRRTRPITTASLWWRSPAAAAITSPAHWASWTWVR